MTGIDTVADSSFLVSLYRRDSNHEAALNYIAANPLALPFSPLNRIELRNALRNAESFAQISRHERTAAFLQIEDDLREGILIHLPIHWPSILRRADELSEQHAQTDGQRTIDLLHVAIALENGAHTFLTFDKRQKKLAQSAGLLVP